MRPEILRNIFLVVFVVSTGILALFISGPIIGNVFSEINSSLAALGTETPEVVITPEPGNPFENPSPIPSGSMNSGALIGSIITSVTSLIGFAVTTVITWRREKREASLADVERKRLETELEKSRLELEELKKSSKKKEVRRKKQ